jgi:hypothetical protein
VKHFKEEGHEKAGQRVSEEEISFGLSSLLFNYA